MSKSRLANPWELKYIWVIIKLGMNKSYIISAITLSLVLVAGLVTPAFAVVEGLDDGNPPVGSPSIPILSLNEVLIDFENCAIGFHPSYSADGATSTSTAGNLECRTLAGTCDGTCAIGRTGASSFPFQPVRTDFPTLVSEVSADMGDQSSDLDIMFMEAYNQFDVLVDSEVLDCGNCIGSFSLSVSGPGIAYIITGSESTINLSSVVVDNILFRPSTAVGGEMIPLDSTMILAAGAQYTAAWMIPVIVAGLGFAIVIARKF